MPPKTAPPHLAFLMYLSALSVLPVNMILPSLPSIARALQADYALISLSVACYALATALVELVAGSVSDRYGRKPIIVVSICLFTIGSIGCALATNLTVFLFCRALQASIAACFSVVLVIVKDNHNPQQAAAKMGYLQAGWALAPMLGPSLGGIIDDTLGWRFGFLLLALLGVMALLLTAQQLRQTEPAGSHHSASRWHAYQTLLSSNPFWAYIICMALSTATLYLFLAGAPEIASELLHGSSSWLGVYMGLVPAGFIAGSFLAGRLAATVQLSRILVAGRLLTCMGLAAGWTFAWLTPAQALTFFGPCIFIGLGNGLSMPAANTAVLSIDERFTGTAAGLAAALSIGGGALIAAARSWFAPIGSTQSDLFAWMFLVAVLSLFAAWAATAQVSRSAV